MPGEIFISPNYFLIPVNSVHFRQNFYKKFNFYIFKFYPGVCQKNHACSLWTRNLLVLRMNFLGSLLLCFLGVALLKIVYKKANQQHVFCFYEYVFQISVQSNDMVLNKSRAIAGQQGLSLLY